MLVEDMASDKILLNSREGSARRTEQLFQMWNERLLRGSTAHFMASLRYEKLERILSIVNISLAITVLFMSSSQKFISNSNITLSDLEVGSQVLSYERIISEGLPFVSLGVVLLSAFQYISQFADRSSSHKQAAVEYANLRRKLERYWSKPDLNPEAIHSLARSYNQVAKFPPIIPKGIWKRALAMKKNEIATMNAKYFVRDLDELQDTRNAGD